MDVRNRQEGGMTRSIGRRVSAVVGGLTAVLAVAAFAAPATAQVPEGTQAIPLVGGPFANCPPGSAPQLVPGGGTINGVTVTGAGRCTPQSADAEGTYTVSGVSGMFTAECHNAGGVIQGRTGVTVPAGTSINGGAPVATATVVETPNASVVFPGGRTATLNTVTTTPNSVTFRAIVFNGGPTVGQVTCGVPAYVLTVGSPGAATGSAAMAELPTSADGGGSSTMTMVGLAAAALALVLLAQVVIGRRIRRSKDVATG